MIRGRGYIYSALVLAADILIGGWIGCVIAALTATYAFFIGEWYAKKKYGAILCEASPDNRNEKLQRCFSRIQAKANQKYTHIPKNTKIFIIPDQKIQAYAFGRCSIGVTEGALNLDTRTLEALIAHEYGHIVNGDSVLSMVLSATTIGFLALLTVYQFSFLAIVYLLIIIACLFGLFKFNFLSYIVTTKLTDLFKKICEFVRHGAFILLQAINRAFGRRGELMADSFAASLGYAFYLRRFLERFDAEPSNQGTILEALYQSHPSRDVRLKHLDREVLRIEQRNK